MVQIYSIALILTRKLVLLCSYIKNYNDLHILIASNSDLELGSNGWSKSEWKQGRVIVNDDIYWWDQA